jgi:hypothetical protein
MATNYYHKPLAVKIFFRQVHETPGNIGDSARYFSADVVTISGKVAVFAVFL